MGIIDSDGAPGRLEFHTVGRDNMFGAVEPRPETLIVKEYTEALESSCSVPTI